MHALPIDLGGSTDYSASEMTFRTSLGLPLDALCSSQLLFDFTEMFRSFVDIWTLLKHIAWTQHLFLLLRYVA